MLDFFAPLLSHNRLDFGKSLETSFGNMSFLWELLLLSLSATLVFALVFALVFFWFRRAGLLDRPDKYGLKRWPVPFAVGCGLYLGFLINCLLFVSITPKLAIILALGGFLVLYTFLDDLVTIEHPFGVRIPPWLRLFFQISIGIIIGLTSIKIAYISWLLDGIIPLTIGEFSIGGMVIYPIALLVSVIWYVLLLNVINWSDEVPGVSTGISLITFLALLALSIKLFLIDQTVTSQANSQFVLVLLALLIPGILIYFFLSLKPRIWGADSGTMFLWFMIATLAIISGGKIATVATVLGVYFIDFFYVIVARMMNGKNPMKWDRIHHLHFRLIALGMRRSAIRQIVLTLTAFFAVAAIFLDKVGKIFFLLFITLLIFSIAQIIESTKLEKED